MNTERTIQPHGKHHASLIDLIKADLVIGLTRFTVEHADVDDESTMQTFALAIPANGTPAHPIAIIDLHQSDDDAMAYAVNIFETLKNKGHITNQQAARYRRSLITLVPCAA